MRIFSLAVLLVSFLLLTACGGGDDGDPTPTPPPEVSPTPELAPPEQALLGYIEANFQEPYAGDCAAAVPGEDAGKLCTTFQGERNNMRAYVVGMTFSEGQRWVFVVNENGWQPMQYYIQVTADNAGVPGIPWPMNTGDQVVVTGTGECLNVREGPGLNQAAVDCINDGTQITLATGPVEADGFQWWQVEGRAGWLVADYLRYPDALEAAPPPQQQQQEQSEQPPAEDTPAP